MTKQETFINAIAPLAQAEYMNRAKWVLPSVCIAQAALESGWNAKAKTLFGIKGKGATLKTTEYINGKYVQTTASFKSYPSLALSVHGYYDLITITPWYSGAVCCPDYITAIRKIAAGGYATDPNYANKVISIIRNYGLTKYDTRGTLTAKQTAQAATPAADLESVARDVIKGKYDNGAARKKALAAAGYNYSDVQKIVNRILKEGK